MKTYLIQRNDNGQFLTADYLRFSSDKAKAQICDSDDAKAIQGWLKEIGINVSLVQN